MPIRGEKAQQVAEEIFDLQKRINLELQAGSPEEANRLQLKISELQREHGATAGVGKDENYDRTAR